MMRKQSTREQTGIKLLRDLLLTRMSMVTAMFLKATREESHILDIGSADKDKTIEKDP
jgi:hypothetical protein